VGQRLDDAALDAGPQQLGGTSWESSTKQLIGATAPSSASTASSIVIASAGRDSL
jgi:hypothetical protein